MGKKSRICLYLSLSLRLCLGPILCLFLYSLFAPLYPRIWFSLCLVLAIPIKFNTNIIYKYKCFTSSHELDHTHLHSFQIKIN